MAGPRAFISFEMEDRWARDFLVGQAKNNLNDVEFTDYSVREPFDEKWKTNLPRPDRAHAGNDRSHRRDDVPVRGRPVGDRRDGPPEPRPLRDPDQPGCHLPDPFGAAGAERDPVGHRPDREVAVDVDVNCR